MNINKIISKLTIAEGKKSQIKVGDVRELLKGAQSLSDNEKLALVKYILA